MNNSLTSWVWQYANRVGNKAHCSLCSENENNVFCCNGGPTGSLGRHLGIIHSIQPISKRYAHRTHLVLNELI